MLKVEQTSYTIETEDVGVYSEDVSSWYQYAPKQSRFIHEALWNSFGVPQKVFGLVPIFGERKKNHSFSPILRQVFRDAPQFPPSYPRPATSPISDREGTRKRNFFSALPGATELFRFSLPSNRDFSVLVVSLWAVPLFQLIFFGPSLVISRTLVR